MCNVLVLVEKRMTYVVYDKPDNKIKLIVDSFLDHEIDLLLHVTETESGSGLMCDDYLHESCEILGVL